MAQIIIFETTKSFRWKMEDGRVFAMRMGYGTAFECGTAKGGCVKMYEKGFV